MKIKHTKLSLSVFIVGILLNALTHWLCSYPNLTVEPAAELFHQFQLEYPFSAARFQVLYLLSLIAIIAGFTLMLIQFAKNHRKMILKSYHARASREQLEQAASLAKLGYYEYDTINQNIIDCTEQHAMSHGLSRQVYLTRASTLANGMPLIDPKDRDKVKKHYTEVLAGKTVVLEYRVITAEGLKYVREITKPVFDEEGRVIKEIGTTLDVTEQKRIEKERLQSQKLEVMGQLAGGVAHDFNNLLAVIIFSMDLLKARLKPSDVSLKHVNSALDAAYCGADLTKNLLSFTRSADLEPKIIDLNEVIEKTRIWAARVLPETIEIEMALSKGLWGIYADFGSTENAILNLIMNAKDAMPDGGRITLGTSNIEIDKGSFIEGDDEVKFGRYVMITVRDTGCGISQVKANKIFEPFYTTKSSKNGTGLGLSMVEGFIKQTGGTIKVDSEVGIGTTLKLYFPAKAHESLNIVSAHVKPVPDKKTNLKILVVEDNNCLRENLTKVLENHGNKVVAAANGDQAKLLFSQTSSIDLVLSDIMMPGALQGPELAKELRQIRPDLPVIFLSGYTFKAGRYADILDRNDIRMMKPVSTEKLIAAIDKTMAQLRVVKKIA